MTHRFAKNYPSSFLLPKLKLLKDILIWHFSLRNVGSYVQLSFAWRYNSCFRAAGTTTPNNNCSQLSCSNQNQIIIFLKTLKLNKTTSLVVWDGNQFSFNSTLPFLYSWRSRSKKWASLFRLWNEHHYFRFSHWAWQRYNSFDQSTQIVARTFLWKC